MKKLLNRLDDFKYYQLAKFIKARPKQNPNDALNDNTDWQQWPYLVIENHLYEEVKEYKKLSGNISFNFEQKEEVKKELADIANLAFLLWAKLEYDD